MTLQTAPDGREPSRRWVGTLAWLGSAALVIGGSTSAVAASSPADGPVPVGTTSSYQLAPFQAPKLGGSSTRAVPGEYIVTLKDSAGLRAAGVRSASTAAQVKAAAARSRKLGGKVTHEFTAALPGYSAALSAAELAKVRADPAVASVRPNQVYRLSGTQKNPESWGLDRVDQRAVKLDKQYYSTATGRGVTAFIVDTGIALGHPDLKNARGGDSIVDGGNGGTDCLGHGTHVAGTVGGTQFGVAKDVTLVPIRVFGCTDEATAAQVVAGLDAVLAQPVTGPRVVNLSLGDDGIETSVDDAVKRVIAAGVTVVIAAGNGDSAGRGQSACLVSPAHVRSAITVGATTKRDERASFSNYASCVDLYAPGVDIISAYPRVNSTSPWRKAQMSGTSMAAPHVTGAVAMYLERHPTATPAQVQEALIKTASPDKVTNVSAKWPRLMLLALQKAVVPKSVTSGNKLRYNQSLVRGNKLCSANGAYCLTISTTGQLVLRKVTGTQKTVWTAGKGGSWLRMTSTGAISSYDSYGRRVWTSGKTGGQATLYVVSSGVLRVVRDSDSKVLWSSNGR